MFAIFTVPSLSTINQYQPLNVGIDKHNMVSNGLLLVVNHGKITALVNGKINLGTPDLIGRQIKAFL